MGDLCSLKIWRDVNLLGTTGPLTYYGSFLREQCLMKLLFMQSGWLRKSHCFHILSDCEVSLLGMVYVGEGEPTYD